MSYLAVDYPAEKPAFYSLLAEQVRLYIGDEPTMAAASVMSTASAVTGPTPLAAVSALANAAAVMHEALADLNWVGFYLVSGDRLVLGPFQGQPAVTEIGYGLGVCGTAWREKTTQIVSDVHTFAGHIACDCASNAELAVPVLDSAGEVLGVIDLDSPLPGRFVEDDAAGLAAVAVLLAPAMRTLHVLAANGEAAT